MSSDTSSRSRLRPVVQSLPFGHERLQAFIERHKEESYAGYILAGPYLLYMLLLFFIPLGYIFLVSFYRNVPTGTMEAAFTLENYVKFLTSDLYMGALYTTVELSVVSTVFTILVSYPIAYFIVFSDWRYSQALTLLVIAPMLVGNVVRAFGWFALMGSGGAINTVLGLFGVQYTLLNTKPGMIIAISSVLMPFAVLILMSVLYTLDAELIEAAYNLGGNPIQTFVYVTLPLSLPGVIGATIISFVLTMGTFATAVFIGMPQVPMIAPFIYDVASTDLNWPLGAAMSFVLLAVSLALVYVYTLVADVGTQEVSA
ncbi:ABC transporter permease [Haloprofundus marisrubri]|uniref:ABC transporter permease n=1 Tax=Haloprofundus marisrubri TaxID=1514971 RepID=UPI0009E4B111|nr:ABC transporter permease [Haloprofundus marisrubri]